MKKNVVTTAVAVLTIVVSGGFASAQTPPAAQSPAPVTATPGQPTAPFVTVGPRVDLSIEEAVARASEKNIDVAVARITPRLTDFSIAALDANYRYNLTTNGS